MSKKLRLGVLFGGRSGEHEVSLMSARSVVDALDDKKYEVIEIGISKEGHWLHGDGALRAFETGDHESLHPVMMIPEPERVALYRQEIGSSVEILKELDVIFPVLHGTFGEDGAVQGLFELAEVPYVKSQLQSLKTMELKMLASALEVNSFGMKTDDIIKAILTAQKKKPSFGSGSETKV